MTNTMVLHLSSDNRLVSGSFNSKSIEEAPVEVVRAAKRALKSKVKPAKNKDGHFLIQLAEPVGKGIRWILVHSAAENAVLMQS